MINVLSDKILRSVEKPSRYIGGEFNSVVKDKNAVDIRFAFCFPDVYEVGMSHLGIKILYDILNNRKDTWCERVFSPWIDMEAIMRLNNIELFGLESGESIKDFDFVGFTLQYELSYTNILNMLDLANIPLFSKDRDNTHPFIVCGGPCAYNPEPIADFADFFIMGESEEILNTVMDKYNTWKKSKLSRDTFLEQISTLQGVYVPKFYNVTYNEDNTIKSFEPINSKYPTKIRKVIIKDMDTAYYPEKFVVPYGEVVHDRAVLELFRGCIRGCRFCQAGYVYRPVRQKSVGNLVTKAKNIIENTGYEEISLASLSTSDYPEFYDLCDELFKITENKRVNLSLPSLRIDSISLNLLERAQKIRKSGLTVAPEAGTQRLRDVINKGVTEEDIKNSANLAFNSGWNNIKLYFMVGLPTETYDDIDGIANVAYMILDNYYQIPKDKRPRGINITVSASSFVPKPFTPFQWVAQDDINVLNEKQYHLKDKLRKRELSFSYHESNTSFLEGVFARGDRRLSQVIYTAWRNGAKFDGWGEHFKFDVWMKAFETENVDPKFYNQRLRDINEVLPWDFVDIGVSKKFLQQEYRNALEGNTTPNCRVECTACGAASFEGGVCFEKPKS